MSVAETKAVIARFLDEVWNQGNLHAIDEMCADGFCHYDSVGRDTHDLASFKQYVVATYAGFPDLHLSIEREIAEGDTVVVQWKLCGTHRGECLGIAPTGKQVELEGVSLYRVAEGRIVESSVFRDRLDLKLGGRVVHP